MFATIDDLPRGRRILARLDLNSPVKDGEVQDNRRFGRHVETLRELIEDEHAVTVLAHQGRPGRDTFVSLEQHAVILEEYLGEEVRFCPETLGRTAADAIDGLGHGDILVLENVRMVEEELADRTPEEHARSRLVAGLAAHTQAYVGDAYSTAHREHASIVGFPHVMPAVAGRVMEREYQANSAIQGRSFDGSVVMVLGGTKADDLFRVIEGVSDRVDTFLLGGVIGELCLRTQGYEVGFDVDDGELFDPIWREHATEIRDLVRSYEDQLQLPTDLAYEDGTGGRSELDVDGLSKSRDLQDIGHDTIDRYRDVIDDAAAVFVKGAVGVFEDDRFSAGTVKLVEAIGESDAFSVIGGGDTSRVLDLYDLDERNYSHVSIAGGAYVRALAGESLAGVTALEAAAARMAERR